MADNKTQATMADPLSYLAAIQDERRRADCETLVGLMGRVSGQPARMWGTAIVGFGRRSYPLSGGRQGEICAIGFSSRTRDIAIYGVAGEHTDPNLLDRLGRHKRGKGCLNIARLADIDLKVLEALVSSAVRS